MDDEQNQNNELISNVILGMRYDQVFAIINRLKQVNSPTTYKRTNPKFKRNAACPCGSNKKFKHCCLKKIKYVHKSKNE